MHAQYSLCGMRVAYSQSRISFILRSSHKLAYSHRCMLALLLPPLASVCKVSLLGQISDRADAFLEGLETTHALRLLCMSFD